MKFSIFNSFSENKLNKKCHQYCTNLDTKKIISICPETEFSQCIYRARERKDILPSNSKKNLKNSPKLEIFCMWHTNILQLEQYITQHFSFPTVMTGEDDFTDQGLEFYLSTIISSKDLLLWPEHPWLVSRSGFSPGPWIFLLRAVTVNELVMSAVNPGLLLVTRLMILASDWPVGEILPDMNLVSCVQCKNQDREMKMWSQSDSFIADLCLVFVWQRVDWRESIILYWPLRLCLWACQVSSRLHTPYTRIISDWGI